MKNIILRILAFSTLLICSSCGEKKGNLYIYEKTVEGHRSNIIEKLGLHKEKNTLLKWSIQNIKN